MLLWISLALSALLDNIWSQFEHLPASFMTLDLSFIYAPLILTLHSQWGCIQVAIVKSVYMLIVCVCMCVWCLPLSEPFMFKALIGLQWVLSRDNFLDICSLFFSDPLKLADSCNSPFKHSRGNISQTHTYQNPLISNEHELHLMSLTWLSNVKYMCWCKWLCCNDPNCTLICYQNPKHFKKNLSLCVWYRRSVQTLCVCCSHLTALICWPVELELSNPCVRMWTSDTVER